MNSKNQPQINQSDSRPGYEYLSVYKLGKVIQDLTFEFCRRYVSRFSRTYDQMIQAARSNPQNVAEGYMGVSLKNYIKLSGIALGSNEELAKDYQDFLRQRGLPTWEKNHPKVQEFRQFRAAWIGPNQLNTPDLPHDQTEAANMLLTFCNMENYLLTKLINALKEKHRREGGFTENLYKKRVDYRKGLGKLGMLGVLLGALGLLGMLGWLGGLGISAALAANSDSFSISIEVKPSASAASKAIVGKAEEMRIVTNANSQPLCQIMSGSTWQTAVVSSAAIGVGVWSQITCTYDHNYLKIYVNGEEKGSQALSVDVDDTSAELKIGADDSTGSTYGAFAGVVDNFYFYNYALNQDEVKALYNQGQAVVMGSVSTASSSANVLSNEASREYCVPGDTSYCAPPVLELKFDEKSGTTTYDTSGNGNDGVFVSQTTSPTWKGAGYCKYGGCLEFDGNNDYIKISDSSSLDITGEITIEAWIKKNSHPSVGSRKTILIKGSVPSALSNYELGTYMTSNNREELVFAYRTDSGSTPHVLRATTTQLELNKWHYVAITYNDTNNTINMYIDGILQEEIVDYGDPENNSLETNDISLYIGAAGSTLSRQFDGFIDQVRIYDYARTPAQIAWEYNRGKPVGWWRFDECSGGTIHDESGNGNHGTLHLGTTGVTATGTCASSSNSFWYNGRNGKINSAGSFYGDLNLDGDYIDVGDVGYNIYSVSFWVKSFSNYDFYLDLNKGNYIYLSEGTIKASSTYTQIYVDGKPGNTIDCNWHHILVISQTGIDASDFDIGRIYVDGSYYYALGLIDEVRLYNYILTETQIKDIYNNGAVNFGNKKTEEDCSGWGGGGD